MDSTSPSAEKSAKLLDVQAVAEMLDCSSRTVYRLRDGGKMPSPVKLGSLVRWSRAAIDQWIAAGCPATRRRARIRDTGGVCR